MNSWNPNDFGETPYLADPDGQLTIFFDTTGEPPDPDDFPDLATYGKAYQQWELGYSPIGPDKALKLDTRKTASAPSEEGLSPKVREQNKPMFKLGDRVRLIQSQRDGELSGIYWNTAERRWVLTAKESDRHRFFSGYESEFIKLRDWGDQRNGSKASNNKCKATNKRKEQAKAAKNIKKRPHGTIEIKVIKGHHYRYLRYRENGHLRSQYLGKVDEREKISKTASIIVGQIELDTGF